MPGLIGHPKYHENNQHRRNPFSRLGLQGLARSFRQFVDENYAAEEVVTIDFSGMQFASRAFMDEFYNLFLSPSVAASCAVKVEVVNLPASVASLLEAVERTNTQPHAHSAATEPEASVIKFTSVEEMNAFFGVKSSPNV